MKTTHELCWWLIGAGNQTQAIAMAIDHHDADAELTRETYTRELGTTDETEARQRAESFVLTYAQAFGIPADRISFDEDSTAYFSKD